MLSNTLSVRVVGFHAIKNAVISETSFLHAIDVVSSSYKIVLDEYTTIKSAYKELIGTMKICSI